MTIKDELNNYWKVDELKKFAAELNIPNRSKLNKAGLVTAIADEIESQ